MSTYAIGDVQGCFDDLQNLLQKINFNKNYDTLWFVGDLVNRGPDSLACLRFIKSLKDGAVVVLGNHDLHLISVAHGYQALANGDTLIDILQADDRDELIEWLCQQPLLHHDSKLVSQWCMQALHHNGICLQLRHALSKLKKYYRAINGMNYSSICTVIILLAGMMICKASIVGAVSLIFLPVCDL
jgi:bis(5'-nucleosyl)-tetraphosphatase (symmetrical)